MLVFNGNLGSWGLSGVFVLLLLYLMNPSVANTYQYEHAGTTTLVESGVPNPKEPTKSTEGPDQRRALQNKKISLIFAIMDAIHQISQTLRSHVSSRQLILGHSVNQEEKTTIVNQSFGKRIHLFAVDLTVQGILKAGTIELRYWDLMSLIDEMKPNPTAFKSVQQRPVFIRSDLHQLTYVSKQFTLTNFIAVLKREGFEVMNDNDSIVQVSYTREGHADPIIARSIITEVPGPR